MTTASILSPWGIRDGANCPQIMNDYPSIYIEDICGQNANLLPPNPNIMTVKVVADSSIIDSIDNNNDYEVQWRSD